MDADATEQNALAALRALIEREVECRVRPLEEALRARASTNQDLCDDHTRELIKEQLLLAHKTYLTRKEAAKYLGVSERSIAEWAARPPDQNPFPESYAGGEPRTKRERIDEWAERERARQRLKLVG
ncbi:MAG: helix-turn-helix domain-containing protein [Pyrinomonadaceae bacterium]